MQTAPLIGVIADNRYDGDVAIHGVRVEYIRAVRDVAKAQPVILPPLGMLSDADAVLGPLDGLLAPGASSDLEPKHYGAAPAQYKALRDPGRDETALALLRRAIPLGMPLLCICRGHQELNVALGGTLRQRLRDESGVMDHFPHESLSHGSDDRYVPVHPITIHPGGLLAQLCGGEKQVVVNSLHGQAIDTLAPSLRLEAETADGVAEAVSLPGGCGFRLAVQWHPEHPVAQKTPLNRAIFHAFGDAARRWRRDGKKPGTSS